MDCAEYYEALYEQQGKILDLTCEHEDFTLHAISHAFLAELQTWVRILEPRAEMRLLTKAMNEFQAALSLLTTGHYRYAFVSLRSALELSLAAIQHSGNLFEHLQWRNGHRDIVWASLVDVENGVLCVTFCREFAPPLEAEVKHVNSLARSVYRSCSEYAHGNAALDAELPAIFDFSAELFRKWHETAQNAAYVIFFALTMRYLNELDDKQLQQVEQHLQEQMGHNNFVRDVLARPRS